MLLDWSAQMKVAHTTTLYAYNDLHGKWHVIYF